MPRRIGDLNKGKVYKVENMVQEREVKKVAHVEIFLYNMQFAVGQITYIPRS
jgi:hypothetical protein